MISVIVPVYKVEAYLDTCIQSIVNQTYTDLEIILVDDGSPDNCPAMCDAWAKKDSRIKVIHKENGGVSSARNFGLDMASGKYVVFVDSDDFVSKEMITELVKAMEAYAGANLLPVVAFCQSMNENISWDDSDLTCTQPYVLDSVLHLHKLRCGDYCWGALYRTDIIERFHLRFANHIRNLEDVLWNTMYSLYVDSVVLVSAPLYFYRCTPGSITAHSRDVDWQINCWIAVRNSLIAYYQGAVLTNPQKYKLRKSYRKYMNNIYAEAIVGGLSMQHLLHMLREGSNQYTYGKFSFFEQFFTDYFCFVEYTVYKMTLKIRYILKGKQ